MCEIGRFSLICRGFGGAVVCWYGWGEENACEGKKIILPEGGGAMQIIFEICK